MGSTVQAFNTLMLEFLNKLCDMFPEDTKVALVRESFDSLADMNPRKPMELFTGTLAPHHVLVMQKNADLFKQDIELPGGLDISKLWAHEDVDDASREAIWQYLQLLLTLGTTVQHLPAHLLETIEGVAMSCATQLGAGGGDMNLSALSNMLMGGLSNIFSAGGGGARGLGALKPPKSL